MRCRTEPTVANCMEWWTDDLTTIRILWHIQQKCVSEDFCTNLFVATEFHSLHFRQFHQLIHIDIKQSANMLHLWTNNLKSSTTKTVEGTFKNTCRSCKRSTLSFSLSPWRAKAPLSFIEFGSAQSKSTCNSEQAHILFTATLGKTRRSCFQVILDAGRRGKREKKGSFRKQIYKQKLLAIWTQACSQVFCHTSVQSNKTWILCPCRVEFAAHHNVWEGRESGSEQHPRFL